MNNNSPEPILELAGKFADDVIDYTVDLSSYLDEGASLTDVEVFIDAAGNGESPPELEVSDEASFATESGGAEQSVIFWLEGGTSGVRYRGVIQFGDDLAPSSPGPARVRTKLFYVVVS